MQRGVATTSVASKKPRAKQEEEEPTEVVPNLQNGSASKIAPAAPIQTGANDKEDWEEEVSAEEAALQAIFERLQDKGEKEIARVIKVGSSMFWCLDANISQSIEFDRRLALSFPKLELNQGIRDQILAFALDEDDPNVAVLPVSSGDDKTLQRLFVAWHILLHLGFSEERIRACLISGIKEEEGWEEALNWVRPPPSTRIWLRL